MEFKSTCAMAFVIATCNRERIPINRTKAQKLLYCCYGTMLAATGERLTDEHPRAWPFGPVFPRTFEAVNRKALTVEMVRAVEEACDPEVLAVLEKMLRFFGTYTSEQLARWSRKSGSPWAAADALGRLDDLAILKYFTPLWRWVDTHAPQKSES